MIDIEKVIWPPAGISYEERRDLTYYKGFDWTKCTKEDAVHFARVKGLKETGMSVNEIALLWELLEKRMPRVMVELGRNFGTSTRIFLAHMMKHKRTSDCYLDSWDLKHWPGFLEAMEENGYDLNGLYGSCIVGENRYRVTIRTPAHSIKTEVPTYIEGHGVDFLLIDTEHGLENALGEYMRWREYLNSGAMIAFHDSTLPGVARAIEIAKEVEWERLKGPGRFAYDHVNESVDGFGIQILEWR